jgi:hypothetical protein
MADSKKAAAVAPDFGDDESVEATASAPSPTPAEMALELERLRKQVSDLQAAAAVPESIGVQYIGDPNETYCGKGVVKGGKFVSTDDGKDIYHYHIDLPPSGGTDIKLCGVPFYHGVGYYVGVDQLRSLREIVSRTWRHEASIRGSNENFYRKETAPVFSGKHGRMR